MDTDQLDGLADDSRALAPAELVRRHGCSDELRDVRHSAFERFGFDLTTAVVPWQWFWSVNCSVLAADFWAAGGFDEDYRTWGGEDLDLGYRLHRGGTAFTVSQEAWALDTPHKRSLGDDLASNAANMGMLVDKHPEPVTELLWAFFARPGDRFVIHHDWNVEDEYRQVLEVADRTRGADVAAELAPLRCLPDDSRVVVLGCGADPPGGLAAGVRLFDFDSCFTGPASPGGRVAHGLGVRLPGGRLGRPGCDHVPALGAVGTVGTAHPDGGPSSGRPGGHGPRREPPLRSCLLRATRYSVSRGGDR